MWLLCPKMRAQIWGYLGQMAHRRQIAQWAGTRTTHPGEAGFETGPPWRPGSRPVLAQNQGVSPRASRRGFFSAPKKLVPGPFAG